MKSLFVALCFVLFSIAPPKLSQVRADYSVSHGNEQLVQKLFKELSSVTKDDNLVLVAYKGAVLTAMAEHSRVKKEKKEFFKEGAGLLEYAVAKAPNNIEIRTIRLSVQENTPRFLKYNKHMEEDRTFILQNFKDIASAGVSAFVKGYVLQSDGFTAAEKDSLR
ncbi:hypothetical protein [Marinirhabdus gelatinilytica]|uniref:Uncharacterized protein n=1 Tax=Marinirhabdus gelatinilytica TaxID=1703343 RepID=A0A370QKA1_9FLAO|nr:hypothetical protein [Marinirhabdus gelatinilytica]RDK88749.1 hypothetical protein C8D94_101626 [Marinirhabdus gelatinilytica]